MQNSKLLPPLPPFVDRRNPDVIAWRQDQHEEAIEHLNSVKLEFTRRSWLPLACMVLTVILGLIGLISPAQVAQILRLFVH